MSTSAMKVVAAASPSGRRTGTTCLGIFIGYLAMYFVRRFTTFSPQVFGSLLSVVVGGAVLKFLGADRDAWWFYPIGLLIGLVLYFGLFYLNARGYPFPVIQRP
jgi:hypothetical protein